MTHQKIKNCKICKTNFYDFCDECHNQTLSYMISDKIKSNPDMKKTLSKLSFHEKKLSELDEEIRILIGEPNEYLKNNSNYCDCDNYHHCFNIAREELKNKFEISHVSLYEEGLDYILCKKCFIEYFKKEPITQIL